MAEKKKDDKLSVTDQPSLRKQKVKIRKDGDVVEVVESAFERVWKDRGWALVKNDAPVNAGLTAVDDKKSDAANSGDVQKEKS